MNVPFVDLKTQYNSIKPEIDLAIKNVISKTSFIGGEHVELFENNFSKKYGVNNCISCANGTDALYITMKMLGIGPGDEVVTVANSWISSSETISQTGAKPIFIDCDSQYYTIDEKLIESKITKNTKAIIPVHLYGQMANMSEISKIATDNNLFVIEDCAQSHFSKLNNINAGLFGDVGTFSFYPGKNLGAYGDAGAIISNNDEYSKRFRLYSKHGAIKKHEHVIEGVNSRMDGIQAAILNVKLNYIEDWTLKRNLNADMYLNSLNVVKEIVLPKIRANSTHSFHLFVIQAEKRDELKVFLKNKNIETAIHYPKALPALEAYKKYNYNLDEFPVAMSLSSKILSLPMYPELQENQINYVSESIREFYNQNN